MFKCLPRHYVIWSSKAVYEHDDVLIDIVEREWGLRCHAVVTTENESVVRSPYDVLCTPWLGV